MKIIIRADSSSTTGSGHIMRCLVLADTLAAPVIFICRDLPGNIISVIKERGYKVETLPADSDAANEQFLAFLKKEKADILVFDNYDIDLKIERKTRHYVQKIVVIDDLANRKHDCDLLIDQNPTAHKYHDLVPDSAIKLFGLQYALLGKDFTTNKKNISTNSSSPTLDEPRKRLMKESTTLPMSGMTESVSNILIFFGGGDHKNLTQKIIESLLNSDNYTNIIFNIVVGISNPNKEKIRQLCDRTDNFKFYCQINNMAELMKEADLFIGAGGTTSWERMCIGLPGVIISIADNQVESCNAMVKFDVAKYLGAAEGFSAQKLQDSLAWIQNNPAWLINATRTSQKMVDGYGAKRVAASIKSLLISLIPAANADCENIHLWRNAAENRRYSINSAEIDFATHQKWFSKIISDKSTSLLVAHYNNKPLGVVRFDYTGNSAEISLYLIPELHSSGMGLSLLFAAENWLREQCCVVEIITAKVIKENVPSVKIFEYALYNFTGNDNKILLLNKRLK